MVTILSKNFARRVQLRRAPSRGRVTFAYGFNPLDPAFPGATVRVLPRAFVRWPW